MTYYDSPNDKICQRGCNTRIIWKGKIEDKRGSTGWFHYDDTKKEHTYQVCDKIIKTLHEKEKHGSLFTNNV